MPPVKAMPSQETAQISKNIGKSESYEPTANWWTAVGTWALAMVGFIQMFITSFFLYRTLGVTHQTAEAATKNAETAVQTLHLTQRAYLIMSEWDLRNGSTHDAPLSVGFDIMNVGHTPAMQVKISMDFLIASSLPEVSRYAPPTPLENLPPTVLLSYIWPQALPMSVPEGTFLWIWGRLTYTDVFEKQHQRGFCAQCDPRRIPGCSLPFVPGYVYDD